MTTKYLDARRKGEYTYDYSNDILLFKIKGRDYNKSIDFGNLVADIDTEGYVTGLRIFDASKVFRLSKFALNNLNQFEFATKVENKVVSIQLRFTLLVRNKPAIKQGQDFIREAIDSNIRDSEVVCTV